MARMICTALIVVMAGCSAAGPPDVALRGGAASDAPAITQAAGTAWRRLAHGTGHLEGTAAAEAVESQNALLKAWQRYDLPGEAPEVDFGRDVVLLLAQADDDCVDELIGLDVGDGALRVDWLPPPGGCNEPLVLRIHAVAVDRRYLPARFTVALEKPFDSEAVAATIQIAAVEGQPPAAPTPPRAMSSDDLDAVFAGHPVRRCTKSDELVGSNPVDGPLSDDRRVARAQRQRAQFGVPSDEATTRDVMASDERNDEYGFPLLESELQQDWDASELTDDVQRLLRQHDYHRNDVEVYLSRVDGIRPGVLVDDASQVRAVRRLLDDELGNGAVLVVENRYEFEAIEKAQRDLGALMGGSGPGSIVSSAGIPGPVTIGMIDPTRDALDRIAATVDSSLVCVYPDLSGVATDG